MITDREEIQVTGWKAFQVTGWNAFGHYGLTHYRIWQKKTAHGMWQRHEWKREDGTTDMEEWKATA